MFKINFLPMLLYCFFTLNKKEEKKYFLESDEYNADSFQMVLLKPFLKINKKFELLT